MFEKFKAKLLTVFASIVGTLGFIGAMGWCCVPLVISFFALFGITSTMFLMTYSWFFLFLAIISLTIAIVLYFKTHTKQKTINPEYSTLTCPNCGYKQKEKIPTNRCVISYKCNSCGSTIIAKESCCIFCDYGDKPCPVGHKK
jgi:hypothetical protein